MPRSARPGTLYHGALGILLIVAVGHIGVLHLPDLNHSAEIAPRLTQTLVVIEPGHGVYISTVRPTLRGVEDRWRGQPRYRAGAREGRAGASNALDG